MAQRPPGDWPADQGASLLPAEWISPWQRLRRNLANDVPAVLAASQLRLQELWRRNREGDLAAPGFWPAQFRALFWPVVVTLLLLLLVGLPLGLRHLWQQDRAPAPTTVEPIEQPAPVQELPAEPVPLLPLAPIEPELELQQEPIETAFEPGDAEATEDATPALDQALLLIPDLEEQQWISAVEVQGDRNLLQLVLGDDYQQLPFAQRQRQADQWLEQIEQQGYDSLELVSATGALLGRSAQVGRGMILWNAPPP